MFLSITTIPHEKQRYPSLGDYYTITSEAGKEVTIFNISETGNDDYNFLIAIHELVEWYLCKKAGISEKVIDEFDLSFTGEGEPGDDPKCPYHSYHYIATTIEKEMAERLLVEWKDYEAALEKLTEKPNETKE